MVQCVQNISNDFDFDYNNTFFVIRYRNLNEIEDSPEFDNELNDDMPPLLNEIESYNDLPEFEEFQTSSNNFNFIESYPYVFRQSFNNQNEYQINSE